MIIELDRNVIIIIIIIYLKCVLGFTRWQWCYNNAQHTNKHIAQITTHAQTKQYTKLHKHLRIHYTQ
jgi:predicted negative regulator of RcsB-dependent stress response